MFTRWAKNNKNNKPKQRMNGPATATFPVLFIYFYFLFFKLYREDVGYTQTLYMPSYYVRDGTVHR